MNPTNNTDNTREELLSNLKNITFAVFMTALPSEMCLEIETMTADGTAMQWIGYDEWQVYKLRKGDPAKWAEILDKLDKKDLNISDLEVTDLGKLVKSIERNLEEEIEPSSLLSDLISILSEIEDTFYCYYKDDALFFFASSDDLKAALSKEYSTVDVSWEDMSTEELQDWWERYNGEGNELPATVFDEV